MTSRREFIQSGIAASAALAGARPALAALGGAKRLDPELFIFDRRYRESRDAARAAAALGIETAETSGDLTSLWYHRLDLRWKRAPMALAGVTARGALFVLETLAADRGMRVLYRGEHGIAQAGCVAHTLAGPAGLVAEAAAATQAGPRAWPLAIGGALAACSAGASAKAAVQFATSSSSAAPSDAARDEPLFSWIIAPRSVARAAV
jgi:hypothetical protein